MPGWRLSGRVTFGWEVRRTNGRVYVDEIAKRLTVDLHGPDQVRLRCIPDDAAQSTRWSSRLRQSSRIDRKYSCRKCEGTVLGHEMDQEWPPKSSDQPDVLVYCDSTFPEHDSEQNECLL